MYKKNIIRNIDLYNNLKQSLTDLGYEIIERGSIVSIYQYYSFQKEWRLLAEAEGTYETISQFKLILQQHI